MKKETLSKKRKEIDRMLVKSCLSVYDIKLIHNKINNQDKQSIKEILEDIKGLNEDFRKDNVPQRFSGDELNDLWEERVIEIIKQKGEELLK